MELASSNHRKSVKSYVKYNTNVEILDILQDGEEDDEIDEEN